MALWVGVCGSGWEVLRDFERGVGGYAVCPMPTTKQCFLNNSILSIPRASDAVTSLCRQQNRETSLPKSLNTSQKIPKIPMSNTRSTSLHPDTLRFRLGKPWGTANAAACCACALRRTTKQHCIQNRLIQTAGTAAKHFHRFSKHC